MNLIFATQNAHKAKEIQGLMPSGIRVLTLADINCDADIPETATTLEGNAALKSAFVVENFGENCFADDTGLEIEGLDGRPGVSSARYAGENKDSDANMDKVLLELKDQPNRKARFRTVISLRFGEEEHQFEGVVEGTIRKEKSGKDGFGYDPIFEPEGYDVTFSEMSMEEKNKISHRGRAVSKLIDYINENLSL